MCARARARPGCLPFDFFYYFVPFFPPDFRFLLHLQLVPAQGQARLPISRLTLFPTLWLRVGARLKVFSSILIDTRLRQLHLCALLSAAFCEALLFWHLRCGLIHLRVFLSSLSLRPVPCLRFLLPLFGAKWMFWISLHQPRVPSALPISACTSRLVIQGTRFFSLVHSVPAAYTLSHSLLLSVFFRRLIGPVCFFD